MTKVYLIRAETAEELVEKMNNDPRERFADKPMELVDGTWVCFVYSEESGYARKDNKPRINKTKAAKEKPSPEQIAFAQELGFEGSFDSLSKLELHNIIQEKLVERKKLQEEVM